MFPARYPTLLRTKYKIEILLALRNKYLGFRNCTHKIAICVSFGDLKGREGKINKKEKWENGGGLNP